MYNLANAPNNVSEVNKPLAQQMKEYSGEMFAQMKDLDSTKDDREIRKRAIAPLEHIF